MQTPIVLPDLGADPVRLSVWFVDPGDQVYEGDRVVEVLSNGATFDVSSPVAGRFVGMDLVEPAVDFQALAKSMGVPSCCAEGPREIADAAAMALERNGPTLIEIPIA